MPWQQRSSRRADLPPDWNRVRRAVLDRDGHRCQLNGPRCTGAATHVDHLGAPDDHRMESLRSLCQTCHMGRTARQAHAARPALKRQPAKHPGML